MPREWLIQHRAGTLAEWAAAEASGPALLAGERAYVTDLKLDVVGDGVTKVAGLGAVGSGGATTRRATLTNPSGLRRWYAKLADQRWDQAVIGVFGNSLVKGQYSNDAGTTDEATWRARGWVPQLRDLFAARTGITVGEGLIQMNDARVTTGGTPQTISSTGIALQGKRIDNGDTLTITLPACTDIKIHWWWESNAASAAFSYTVDGGGSVTATAPSGSDLYPTESITGLANTTHTLVITGPATKYADISCVAPYVNTAGGVAVHRIHASGGYHDNVFTVGTGTSAVRVRRLSLQHPGADLAVLAFGQNEAGTGQAIGYTPTTFAAALAEIVTYQTGTNGGSALILGGPRKDPATVGATYTEDAYYDAAKAVAVADANCAFLDLRPTWGTFAEATAAGYMYDTVHPKRFGHSAMAAAVFEAIAP